MSFFSIHKILKITAMAVCFVMVGSYPAMAQTNDLKSQIKNAEKKITQDNMKERKTSLQDASSTVVIELFTAPDCSACIYADRMLYDAMKKENVIGLSCYIANRAGVQKNDENFSQTIDQCIFRQWAYSKGQKADYGLLSVPEFVFNGTEKINSTSLSRFDSVLNQESRRTTDKTQNISIQWHDNDTLAIKLPEAEPRSDIKESSSVYLIRYKDMMVEKVETGVNKGRVLRFSNIIQSLKHIAKWHGKPRTIMMDVEKPIGGMDRGGYVVIIQKMLGDDILAAGKVSDYPVSAKK